MDWEKFSSPEDVIRVGKQSFDDFNKFLPLVPVVFLAILLISGAIGSVYSIGPDEVGVIQRFGKYIRLSPPGLHVKIPFGIEKVTPIKVEKVYKEEFGTGTKIRSGYTLSPAADDNLMLTGDLNILDVRWIVQFRIKDPVKFLFAIRDPVDIMRDISEVVMRRLVGDYTVDEVLTTKREEIDDLAQIEMQKIIDEYQTGIQLVTIKLLDVNPPETVKPAFNEVNEAKQEKEKMINQAWEAYNKVIPKARGEAEKTIREAEGYALDKVNRAKGESEKFIATLAEYEKAPEITRKRLYLETLMECLPRAKDKYVIDPTQTSILPLLKIGEKGAKE